MTRAHRVLQVAVPAPLFKHFDYDVGADPPARGVRVLVPFGRGKRVGIVLGVSTESTLAPERLKGVLDVLDDVPLLPERLISLLEWAATYYHHPLGEVLAGALPAILRSGRPAEAHGVRFWVLTEAGRATDVGLLSRAPAQRRIVQELAAAADGLDAVQLAELLPAHASPLRALVEKGLVAAHQRDCLAGGSQALSPGPSLNASQQSAVTAISGALDRFQCHLLHGVTGSGKTEVYLHAIELVLARNKQALVLVPEIGLTPQLVNRFRARFSVPIAMLHSGLSDQERLCAWLAAQDGRAPIVLGTRSAVFVPLKSPGILIVDEEHDGSYKQQDGFRYHARDVAVMRAARDKIPVVLGSATPSLESMQNAREGNYQLIELPERTGAAVLPSVQLLDMRRLKATDGLSAPLREAIAVRLAHGEQSLLFLNRRGFAPVWMCHDCGWVAVCRRCDARLFYHQGHHRLRCHHCGHEEPLAEHCPQCATGQPKPLGEGTERIETAIARCFPSARIERIDRDTTRRKGSLEEKLARVHAGEADILVGTQMLSKGHDFPNVTLVGVLNADQGLYSVDFRAPERLFQQIAQVSGRAGRAEKPGAVLIQTWHPDHPLFAALARHDFPAFVDFALNERRETGYPPFSFLALLRAESPKRDTTYRFLENARALAGEPPEVSLTDPMPAPMERRQGRYRAQLLVQSRSRKALHAFLHTWVSGLAESAGGRQVRWSLDVDPQDLF